MNVFFDSELAAFIRIYKQKGAALKIAQGEDLHQQFADELLLDRDEAKTLCHKINYTYNMGVFTRD